MAKQSDNGLVERPLASVEARLVIGPGMQIVVSVDGGLVTSVKANTTHPGTGPVEVCLVDYDTSDKEIVDDYGDVLDCAIAELEIDLDPEYVERVVKEA